MDIAQKHPDQFLAEYIFPGLLVDEFKFGRGASGNLGLNMISRYVIEPVETRPGWHSWPEEGRLAVHLNCFVKASALQNNTITIHVSLFHLTVRSLVTQQRIDAYGASVITADNSIHMNVNTGWGRPENLRALASEVGVDPNQPLVSQIQSIRNYNHSHMTWLVKTFRWKVEQRIHQLLGGDVRVYWKGDKSFPITDEGFSYW